MRLTVSLPLRFKALPARCSGRKDVFVSFGHVVDVPEISGSEASVVFEAATKTPYRLVEYSGRLFRKLGSPGTDEVANILGTAFSSEEVRNETRCFTSEDTKREYPVSKALHNILAHRFYLEGDGRRQEEEAWPFKPVLTGMRGRRETRNDFRYEELAAKLSDIDADDFERGRKEHRREAEKLLLVDGELWMETPPPAIEVTCAGYQTSARMLLQLVHLPNWLDNELDRQYFPLNEHARAVEYAEMASGLTKAKSEYEDYSRETPFEASDSGLLDFDHMSYSANRTAMILGGDTARWLKFGKGLAERVGDDRIRSVFAARDRAHSLGPDISEWPDMGDLAYDVTEAWKLIGRKPGWAEIPQNRHAFGTMICERATDAAAVSLFVSPAVLPRPVP